MKTKLLFAFLLSTALSFSQTFDNIPTGSGYYINKIIASPSGSDLTKEYIEVRGTANATIPSDLYLISIEGDGNSSSRGKVSEAIQLGDGTRTFGSNGIFVIVCDYTDTDDSTVTTNAFDGLISSDATVLTIMLSGSDVTSSSSSAVASKVPDIGYDGNLIDQTGTYMLVSASSNPKGVRIDGTTDATDANGVINSTGDHTSWTLYDSVTYMDDNDEGNGEYGYGQIIFAQDNNNTTVGDLQYTTTSAMVYSFSSSSDVNIMMRQSTNTGFTTNDWVAAATSNNDNPPNWHFSTTTDKVLPAAFEGWEGLNTVYGAVNPSSSTLSVGTLLESDFNISPNPVKDYVSISTDDINISSVELYNVMGQKLLETTNAKDKINVSTLKSGIYLLKINAGEKTLIKKIIKE